MTGAVAALWLVSRAAVVLAGPAAPTPVGEPWSAPQTVFTTADQVSSSALIADSAGDLHLVFAVGPRTGQPSSLLYARWHDGVWSAAVPVIGRGGTAAAPVLALDGHGYLHMLYEGPRWGQLEYRQVHVSRAADPTAWTRPRTVSDGGSLHSAIIAAPDDRLHVLYASRRGNVIYKHAARDGRTWSGVVAVSAVDPTQQASDGPRLALDARGRLHAAWTQFALPTGWPPMGAFYSRSTDGGRTWSPPRQVAGERYGQINVITRGADEVHLVWNSVVQIGVRVHSWSRDGGETWSTPAPITTRVSGGWTGNPALAFDSAGTLHMITAVDGPKDVERVFHLWWDGAAWSEPEAVAGTDGVTDYQESPAAAIGDGNRLHVVGNADKIRLWSRDRVVAAPALPPVAVPGPDYGLGALVSDASPPLRVLVALLALLAIEATVSGLRRLARRGAR
jgi:hypothetical protein